MSQQYKNSKGKAVPCQPKNSLFPLYLYSYEHPESGQVEYTRPYAMQAFTSAAVGIAATLALTLSQPRVPNPLIQGGLTAFAVLGLAGGLSALYRQKTKGHQQLVYFDKSALIIDDFGQKLIYMDHVPDIRLEMVDVLGRKDSNEARFLQITNGSKHAFIGAFLQPEELPAIKEAIEKSLAEHPSIRLPSFKSRNAARRAPRGPDRDVA